MVFRNLNSSFITLIPKVDRASLVTQFRPIALSNFIFKIIPKIIVKHLKPIAFQIVSSHQVALLRVEVSFIVLVWSLRVLNYLRIRLEIEISDLSLILVKFLI